ncbi:MAG: hypothetical protein AAF430_21700 [Myxococcota bacterium]
MRTFPCTGCGADLVFSVGLQALACPYCGTTRDLDLRHDAPIPEQDLLSELARLAELRDGASERAPVLTAVSCDSCGAELRLGPHAQADRCAYCDAVLVGTPSAGDTAPIDGILPFRIQAEAAHEALEAWQRALWFAPNAFVRARMPDALQRIYLPYWCFDALTFTRFTGERGTAHRTTVKVNGRRTTHTRWSWKSVSGSFQHVFDDHPVPADATLPGEVLRALAPWPTERCVPFEAGLLAGAVTKACEIELPEAFKIGKREMESRLGDRARQQIGGDDQRVHRLETRWDALAYKHLLLPVWVVPLRWRERVYWLVVNAETGEVQGERPISKWKVGLAIAAALLAVLGVALLKESGL